MLNEDVPVAKRDPQVSGLLTIQDKLIEELSMEMDKLAQRLEPILRQESTTCDTKPDVTPLTPLGMRISNNNGLLRVITEQVIALRDLCEL